MEIVRSVVTRSWWEDRGRINSWSTEDFYVFVITYRTIQYKEQPLIVNCVV